MPLLKRKSTASNVLKTITNIYDDAKSYEQANPEKAKARYKKILNSVAELGNEEDLDQNATKISEVLTNTGNAMSRLDDKESAKEFFEKAKVFDPKNAEALYNLGKILISQNIQLPDALLCLKEAVNSDPKNTNAKILLADVYRLQGDKDKALEIYKEVVNEVQEKSDIINKILKLDPNNKEVLLEKVAYLKSINKLEELPETYKKLAMVDKNQNYITEGLELFPNNQSLLIEKARFLVDDKQYNDAKNIISDVLANNPDNAEAQSVIEEIDNLSTVKRRRTEGKKEELVDKVFEDICEPESETKEIKSIKPEQSIDSIKTDILSDSETLEADLKTFKDELYKLPTILKEVNASDDSIARIVEFLVELKEFELAKPVAGNIKDSLKNNFYAGYILFKSGKIEESEKFFNDILKVSVDCALTWYYKAAVVAWKKNENACKNFLMMAIKKESSLKEKAKVDESFSDYRANSWFKSLIS
jgi:tetratricopeptide (TPR) repeat protein